jgi:hypothetical protein
LLFAQDDYSLMMTGFQVYAKGQSMHNMRTYVQDLYLNVATCQQVISLAKANIGDVDFPPDLTGVNALDCSPAPNTSPSGTGYPNIDGKNIVPGNFCNLSAGFVDATISLCSGSYKIARTWTVIDWCPGNPPSTALQIIEVLDQPSGSDSPFGYRYLPLLTI